MRLLSALAPARRDPGEPTGAAPARERERDHPRPRHPRRFVAHVVANEPSERQRFHVGFLSDGERVTWEYPRQADRGEQMDVVEVIEVRDGLIQHHRVYWG